MLVSDKQQQANRRNAQRSSGPKTSEGRAAVRLNALKYGLRARSTVIHGENPEDYTQLADELEAEWHPQTRSERIHLETVATSQWLLARVAKCEGCIYERMGYDYDEKSYALLQIVAKQRAQLERSYRIAAQDLKQSQKDRQSQPHQQPDQAVRTGQAAQPEPAAPAPPPGYVMSEGAESHEIFCAPAPPDTR